jgi:hypothetical protein
MHSDQTEAGIPETAADQDVEGQETDAAKRVPVTESIRYRKRAQSAEKQAETLAHQLAEANQQIERMSQSLEDLRVEQALTRKLTAAGVTDLEAAVLLAKAGMQGDSGDVDDCVERLRTEKSYLFAGAAEVVTTRKTAGVRERAAQNPTALERAATRAAHTGSRADLQEYLRLRRNMR